MGRPRIYADNAERQAAFRQRKRRPNGPTETPLYDAMVDAIDVCHDQTLAFLQGATVEDLKAVAGIAKDERLENMARVIRIHAQRSAGMLLIELKERKKKARPERLPVSDSGVSMPHPTVAASRATL